LLLIFADIFGIFCSVLGIGIGAGARKRQRATNYVEEG